MSKMLRLRAKRIGALLSFASALAAPAVAHADEPKKDCEPGSWFCGETQTGGKDLQPLPPADATPEKASTEKAAPVVVYQPPPPTVVVQAREAPPPYYYIPRKGRPKKEWGLNLHGGGAMIGGGHNNDAGMGFAGVGLRYRPIPHLAFDADLDFAAGRDYNDLRRRETSLGLNALVFLNPRNITQVYLVGGVGWSFAHAVDDHGVYANSAADNEYDYAYFGVQGGVGMEFRLSHFVALNVDLRGMIRGRIDDDKSRPEFVSADGRTTNSSGAGLLRGGLTFYW